MGGNEGAIIICCDSAFNPLHSIPGNLTSFSFLLSPSTSCQIMSVGSESPCHQDPFHNVLCQIYGTKTALLFAPSDRVSYTHHSNDSYSPPHPVNSLAKSVHHLILFFPSLPVSPSPFLVLRLDVPIPCCGNEPEQHFPGGHQEPRLLPPPTLQAGQRSVSACASIQHG